MVQKVLSLCLLCNGMFAVEGEFVETMRARKAREQQDPGYQDRAKQYEEQQHKKFMEDIFADTSKKKSLAQATSKPLQKTQQIHSVSSLHLTDDPLSSHSSSESIGPDTSESLSSSTRTGSQGSTDFQDDKASNVLDAFHSNFEDFETEEDAQKFVKNFLQNGGDANLKNAEGKTLLSMLLDTITFQMKSRDYVQTRKKLQNTLDMTKILIDHGAKSNKQDMYNVLNMYRDFVKQTQIEHQVPSLSDASVEKPKQSFLSRTFSRLFQTESQKNQKIQEQAVASKLAEFIFTLEQATPQQEITIAQQKDIQTLERYFKTVWQQVLSWWQRLWKK